MSSLNKVRLSDGQEIAIAEWYHQPRYSTIEFAATASVNLRMWNYTVGNNVSSVGTAARQSTEADTNQIKKKAMNQDEALIVMAITYETFGLTSATDNSALVVAPAPMTMSTDLRRLQHQGIFELKVGAGIKKPQYEVPFSWLCQSIGTKAYASPAGTTTVRIDYGTGGEVSADNQELLALPIYIGGFGQQAKPGNSMFFEGRFYNGDGGAFTGLVQNFRIRFYLDGLQKRPA